jgi:5-dehydro-4-deoxyglucarate dehydratase
MKLIGRDAGPVRTPLTDLTEDELGALKTLMAGRT